MPLLLSSENADGYLLRSHLATEQELKSIQIEAGAFGKNFNLLVRLPKNRQLLVKQERHFKDGKTANEFSKEWQFHQLLRQFPELTPLCSTVSEVIHFDAENSILVYNYLFNYQDLSQFYLKEQTFPTIIAATIGKALALLHKTTLDRHECCDFLLQFQKDILSRFYNPAHGLNRLSPEIFGSIPDDCLKFFILYQRYESLQTAIANLTDCWHPCCVTHNDLKLNNILLHKDWKTSANSIRLIDWERCDWGDPAFDLGTILASYLQIWLNSIVADPSMSVEESLERATTPLMVLRPSIVALIESYLRNFPEILQRYPNFLERTLQFAGLSLIERIRVLIDYQKQFNNICIYLLQVAKSLLCQPNRAFSILLNTTEAELAGLQ